MDVANFKGRLVALAMGGLVGLGLWAGAPPGPTGADQPPGPVGQASLQAHIASQNGRLHTLAVQLDQAEVRDQQVEEELAVTQATLAADARRVASLRALLRRQAVTAFTEQGSTSATQELLEQRANQAVISEGYLSVTTDRVGSTIDALRVASLALQAKRSELEQAQSEARGALQSLTTDRQSLLADLAQEEGLLAKLRTPPPAGPPTPAGVSAIAPAAAGEAGGQAPQLATPPPPTTASSTTASPMTASPSTAAAPTAEPSAPPATTAAPPTTAPSSPPVTMPTQAPNTAPPAPPAGASSSLASDFAALRECESGGNYQTNTGNGYYGAYQFAESTWLGLGYSGYPNQAPPAVQDQAAEKLQAEDGWAPWPACSAMLGL